jgi:hypothetical protein
MWPINPKELNKAVLHTTSMMNIKKKKILELDLKINAPHI